MHADTESKIYLKPSKIKEARRSLCLAFSRDDTDFPRQLLEGQVNSSSEAFPALSSSPKPSYQLDGRNLV